MMQNETQIFCFCLSAGLDCKKSENSGLHNATTDLRAGRIHSQICEVDLSA